jgi:hypothetical protein
MSESTNTVIDHITVVHAGDDGCQLIQVHRGRDQMGEYVEEVAESGEIIRTTHQVATFDLKDVARMIAAAAGLDLADEEEE